MNAVGAGSSYGNRTGFAIAGKYIQIDWAVYPPSSNTVTDQISFALVYDKQCNAAAPAYADIFDLTSSGVVVPGLELKSLAIQADRFVIARRWFSDMTCLTGSTCGCRGRVFYKIPMALAECRYSGTAAAVPQTGGWFLAARALSGAGNGASSASLAFMFRFAFLER